ncbi:MAG: hypothetical protein EBE86_005255 [Hormoscilla sp. GUM202]|nr:hypothetical protein [Hormoscilla sp. GUM202]
MPVLLTLLDSQRFPFVSDLLDNSLSSGLKRKRQKKDLSSFAFSPEGNAMAIDFYW